MKGQTAKLLGKAARAIEAAKHLQQRGDADFAISRDYYAMLYVAEALLSEQGQYFRKHSGVHAAFGEHFAKTAVIYPKYHRWLLDTFDKRLVGDYGIEKIITSEEAEVAVQQAREFLAEARLLLMQQC